MFEHFSNTPLFQTHFWLSFFNEQQQPKTNTEPLWDPPSAELAFHLLQTLEQVDTRNCGRVVRAVFGIIQIDRHFCLVWFVGCSLGRAHLVRQEAEYSEENLVREGLDRTLLLLVAHHSWWAVTRAP